MNHIIEAEKEYRNVRSIIMLDRYKKNKEREREREREIQKGMVVDRS